MNPKFQLKILIPVLILVVLDLVIKVWIRSVMGWGEEMKLIGDLFSIVPVQNLGMAFGFRQSWELLTILGLLIKLLFFIFFLRIHRRAIAEGFKWGSSLVLFGWVGIFLDRLFFSGGDRSYVSMDYFYDKVFTQSVTSITTIMILAGWMILIIVTIARFRDFKKIFAKQIA